MFLLTTPPALLALVLLARQPVPPQSARRRTFDLAGFLSLLALVFGGTIAIEAATEDGGTLPTILGLALAVAGLAGLFGTQKQATNPLLPPALFRIPAIRGAMGMTTFHGAALVSLVTLIPLFHAILRADGALETALSMLALTVAFGISGFVTGNLITLTGRTVLFPSITLVISALGIVHLGLRGADLGRVALMANYLLIGLANGTSMSVINTIVQYAAPDTLRGRAAGAVTFFRSLGAVLGTALTSAVLFAVAPLAQGADAGALLSGQAHVDASALGQWRLAFSIAFTLVASYVAGVWAMALANPLKRLE
jgi:hypothetical protein